MKLEMIPSSRPTPNLGRGLVLTREARTLTLIQPVRLRTVRPDERKAAVQYCARSFRETQTRREEERMHLQETLQLHLNGIHAANRVRTYFLSCLAFAAGLLVAVIALH